MSPDDPRERGLTDAAAADLRGARLRLTPTPVDGGLEFSLVEDTPGRTVGNATLWTGRDPEIGFEVFPQARGRGYAAEAAEVIAQWAFDCGAGRLLICCDVGNLASARTALAAGFRFEGVARNGITSRGRIAAHGVPEPRGDLARFSRLPDDPPGPVPRAFAPLPAAGLSDGVVTLRVTTSADAVGFFEQECDPVTVASGFSGQAPPLAAVEQAARRAGLDWLVAPVGALTIVDTASGSFAGAMRLRRPGPPGVGGIGYAVHPAFRGRGFTSRALRLLAQWALSAGGFARLELGAKIENVASRKAALAAGFVHEGTVRNRLRAPDGSYRDEARFVLLRPGA